MKENGFSNPVKARAVASLMTEPFTWYDFIEIVEKNDLKINSKSFGNLINRYPNCFRKEGKAGRGRQYHTLPDFFKRFQNEKDLYKNILINDADQIEKNFEIATQSKVVAKPKKIKPRIEFKLKPRHVYIAIFAAYKKSLSPLDVQKIAETYGYVIQHGTIRYFCRHNKDLMIHSRKIGTRFYYEPSVRFFEKFKNKESLLCRILPDKKDDIIERFNSFLNPPKKTDKPDNVDTGFDMTRVNAAAGIEERASNDVEKQEVDDEMIEASAIGAAIVQYINKLKRKTEINPDEYELLKRKYEDSQQALINSRNEIQSMTHQLDKLKDIIEVNNKKILDLTAYIGTLENRKQGELHVLPTKFKMSEVAKIKSFIKQKGEN